jgi:hypothetical protein
MIADFTLRIFIRVCLKRERGGRKKAGRQGWRCYIRPSTKMNFSFEMDWLVEQLLSVD